MVLINPYPAGTENDKPLPRPACKSMQYDQALY